MKVILDTCVLSETLKPRPDPRVRQRVDALAPEDIFLSVITIGELLKGILRLPAGRRRQGLLAWLQNIEDLHGPRVMPVDVESAHIWGEIAARASSHGKTIPLADGLIAATGIRHGLHVMTRNSADFQATGALIIDPWQ